MATTLNSRLKQQPMVYPDQLASLLSPKGRAHQQGFTLTELLVVLIIAGALAAIAAPGWLTFMNRQRVSTANKEVLQALRNAQTEAIAKRTTYGVLLNPGAPTGPTITKFTAKGQDPTDVDDKAVISTDLLGELGANSDTTGLILTTIPDNVTNEYRFNFDGSVDQSFIPVSTGDYVYKIQVEKQGARRCVIVETLLGAMREGQGDDCDA